MYMNKTGILHEDDAHVAAHHALCTSYQRLWKFRRLGVRHDKAYHLAW